MCCPCCAAPCCAAPDGLSVLCCPCWAAPAVLPLLGCPCCATPVLSTAGVTQCYQVPFSCFDQSALHVSLDLGKYIGIELVTQVCTLGPNISILVPDYCLCPLPHTLWDKCMTIHQKSNTERPMTNQFAPLCMLCKFVRPSVVATINIHDLPQEQTILDDARPCMPPTPFQCKTLCSSCTTSASAFFR